MKITYESWRPGAAARDAIAKAEAICREFAAQGYNLTLRQLYYQFVARDLFPDDRLWSWTGRAWLRDPTSGTKNADPNYKWLGAVVNNARMAGLLDWNYLVDRTRNLQGTPHWDTPHSIINSAASSFRIDKWADQPTRVEVWVEKEALAGVIQRVADTHDVDWFSCRGYVSQSEQWSAGQRIRSYIQGDQDVVILHLGDHDPSGLDMTRDIRDRLDLFIGWPLAKRLEVRRVALNYDQILELSPPPNPTKMTDPRASKYRDVHGDESWELDALTPTMLNELVAGHIEAIRDIDLYQAQEDVENHHRTLLSEAAERWDEIVEVLES